jgi:hypothetical protein
MATTAVRNANTVYISSSASVSTIDAVTAKNTVLVGAVLTAGAAAETLAISDVTTTAAKLSLKAAAGTSVQFDFSEMEILFPNGIRVTPGQTDAVATLIIRESRA